MLNSTRYERTNYFRVMNEKKLKQLCEGNVVAHDTSNAHFALMNEDGQSVLDIFHEESGDYTSIIPKLQEILHPQDSIISTSITREKMRYLGASTVVITKNNVEFINLESVSIKRARELLKDPEYCTQMHY